MTDAPTRPIRLYVDQPLLADAEIALAREASHYLVNVMRVDAGDSFLAFNGASGEWLVEVLAAAKRGATLRCRARTRPPAPPPDVELLFAPVKKTRTDFIVEKATELGCRRLRPVLTRRTNAERVKTDRLRAHMIEAAEQCGLVFVPEIEAPRPLADALSAWPEERRLFFCDETGGGRPLAAAAAPSPAARPLGPQGGFHAEEAAMIRAMPFATAVSLGPRILRADTAAAAALSLWQSAAGDWRETACS